MPVPHVIFCLLGAWDRWLIPICTGRVAAGLGLHEALPLTRPPGLDIAAAQQDGAEHNRLLEAMDSVDKFQPDELQKLADLLRGSYRAQPSVEIAEQIRWLERRRDIALRQRLLQTQFAFDLEFLVSCLVLAGFLRNMAAFSEALRFAICVGVYDVALRNHILSDLRVPRAVPSTTTLRRHRLTVHMGFCLWEQQHHEALVQHGCVRYGTVDSSPQGPHDWVLHGARTSMAKTPPPFTLLPFSNNHGLAPR